MFNISEAVDRFLESGDIKSALEIKESFSVGDYVQFSKNPTAYYAKDQGGDVSIVFSQPMDGNLGKLNSSVPFKLIAYSGGKAKLIAMTNDNVNDVAAGEIYFIKRDDLESHGKKAKPRSNSALNGKYKK